MSQSRKHNTFLPRNIIFVETKEGMEYAAKGYAPQRWVKSIGRDGVTLTFTRDPRLARRFKTQAQAAEVCERYANNLVITLKTDQLRYTADSEDIGWTYRGYYCESTDTNYDLYTSKPVELPANYVRIMEIMGKKI